MQRKQLNQNVQYYTDYNGSCNCNCKRNRYNTHNWLYFVNNNIKQKLFRITNKRSRHKSELKSLGHYQNDCLQLRCCCCCCRCRRAVVSFLSMNFMCPFLSSKQQLANQNQNQINSREIEVIKQHIFLVISHLKPSEKEIDRVNEQPRQ